MECVLSQVHALCTHTCKSPDVHPLELLVTNLQCDLSKRYIRGKNRVVNFLSIQHTPTWSHLLLILMCVCVCVCVR